MSRKPYIFKEADVDYAENAAAYERLATRVQQDAFNCNDEARRTKLWHECARLRLLAEGQRQLHAAKYGQSSYNPMA